MSRLATVIIRMDLSESPHSDNFWSGYFTQWAKRTASPATAETTIVTASTLEADDVVIPLVKRKGITDYSKAEVKDSFSDIQEGWTL